MNGKPTLIEAFSAIPCSEPHTTLAPLTGKICTESLVCLLGQQFSVTNNYMQMLAGTTEPWTGSIHFADSLLTADDNTNCPTIAYIYHNSALLSVLNGIDNVKVPALYHQLASANEIDEQVRALIGELDYGANHSILPAFMSALQKQHLLIVRAIMLKPRILFIENPFSNLDRDQERILGQYLSELVRTKNITLVLSNSNLDFVRTYADQVIYITQVNTPIFNEWHTFSTYINGNIDTI